MNMLTGGLDTALSNERRLFRPAPARADREQRGPAVESIPCRAGAMMARAVAFRVALRWLRVAMPTHSSLQICDGAYEPSAVVET